MKENEKDKLPQMKMEETPEIKPGKTEEPEIQSIEDNKDKIDTTPSESDSLGISDLKTKNKLEEGDNGLASSLKLDDKLDKHITELLQSKLNSSVQDVKKDFLIIFGLFASFVTFISINVQVFKNNDNIFELIGICSISLSFIIFFAILINGIVKDNGEWKDIFKPTFILTTTFLIIGIFFLFNGSKNREKRKEIENRITKDSIQINILKNDIKYLHNKLNYSDSTDLYLKAKIDSIQSKLNIDTNKKK